MSVNRSVLDSLSLVRNFSVEMLQDIPEVGSFADALKNLEAAIASRMRIINQEGKNLEESCTQLRKEWTELREEKAKILSVQIQQQNLIKLNIGGSIFATSGETIRKDVNSMLYAMFSGKYNLYKGEDGAYFIDRDGTHFRYILNFLRDGNVILPQDKHARAEILVEARFYQISQLIQMLEEDKQEMSKLLHFQNTDGVTISSDERTAKSARGNLKTIITKESFKGGRHYWEISVKFGPPNRNTNFAYMIGVADESINRNETALHSNGWCFRNSGLKSPRASGVEYAEPFHSGDIIGVLLDIDRQTLNFYKNGKDQGIAFTSLPSGKALFPAVSLNNMEDEATIVKYQCQTESDQLAATY
eukprot:TRINITY_DN9137_c0_g1_i1.p1 TRINITY_DN9137_c0_g1~~TRINITY_DN9137_c0_g1_i1.p1  ORF type:complete len:368 (+),score=87.34 TRINITY_DN9137_c0_g1_i1:25-1104(+)